MEPEGTVKFEPVLLADEDKELYLEPKPEPEDAVIDSGSESMKTEPGEEDVKTEPTDDNWEPKCEEDDMSKLEYAGRKTEPDDDSQSISQIKRKVEEFDLWMDQEEINGESKLLAMERELELMKRRAEFEIEVQMKKLELNGKILEIRKKQAQLKADHFNSLKDLYNKIEEIWKPDS